MRKCSEGFELLEGEEPPFHDKLVSILKHTVTFPCMRASWFLSAVNAFVESNCTNSLFVSECMHGALDISELRNILENSTSDFVILPVILSSYLCHMTVVIIDKTRQRIVYFDPYGTSPLYEIRTVSNIQPSATGILHLLCSIALWTGFQVLYSPTKEQSILHPFQCGAFSKAFIERAILFPNCISVLPLS